MPLGSCPIDAALNLKRIYSLSVNMIAAIKIMMCAFSAELSGYIPKSTPIAQYVLAWSVAAALWRGRGIDSGITEAYGGPNPQPTDAEVISKYRAYAGSGLPEELVLEIESAVMPLDETKADFKALLDLLVEYTSGS
jgi:hypothetical protein